MVSDCILQEEKEEGGCEFAPIEEEANSTKSQEDASAWDEESVHWRSNMSESGKHLHLMRDGFKTDFSHGRVPKYMNLEREYSDSHEGPPTTMMVRNIPNRYTQKELIREMESLGFAGTYDFVYLPMDKATMGNVGYAFVNFVNHESARRCMEVFDQYMFKKHRSKARAKIATVSVAHIQGLEANLRHYSHSVVGGMVTVRPQRGSGTRYSPSSASGRW